MSIASKSQTRLAFIVETVPGTTPATPVFQVGRVTGESLSVDREFAFTDELNGARGEIGGIPVYSAGSGGLSFEYSHGMLDTFIQSALRSAWAADAIVDANTETAITVETTNETGTTDVYKRVTGAQVDKLSLKLAANEKMTGSLDLMGMSGAYGTGIIAGATYTAPSTEPIIAGPSIGAIALAGLTVDSLISVDIEVSNSLSPRKVLSRDGPLGLATSKLTVTGKISLFLNSTEIDVLVAFQNGTVTGLDLMIGAVTLKKLRLQLFEIILSDVKTVSQSKDGDVIVEASFRARQSAANANNVIKFTRNVA